MRDFWTSGVLTMTLAAVLAPGCGDDDGPVAGTDAGSMGADAGSGGGDGGARVDAGAGDIDGGVVDAGSVVDGGLGARDAGSGPVCELVVRCVWVGATPSSCGTLVCGDGGTPTVCGGIGGASCAASEFCDYAIADICGAADATGLCRRRPDVCPVMPPRVCGCDGLTYTNACIANMAGVAVASTGACP